MSYWWRNLLSGVLHVLVEASILLVYIVLYCWWKTFFRFAKDVTFTTTKPLWRFSMPWQFWVSNLQGLSLCYCAFIEHIKCIILSLTLIERSHCVHSWNCFLDRCVFCLIPLIVRQHWKEANNISNFSRAARTPAAFRPILIMCSLVNLFHGICDYWMLLDHSIHCFCSHCPLSGTGAWCHILAPYSASISHWRDVCT